MSAPLTSSRFKPPFRLPSASEHWRDLRSRPAAWMAIARNLVPVVGVFAFGWSRSLVVFDFWWDGLTALAAILAAVTPRAVRETAGAANVVHRFAMGLVTWVFLVGIVCLPYWIVLIPLHGYILDPEMWRQVRSSPGLWATFGGIALTHAVTAVRRGYAALPEREMKQALRWDAYLLVLKALGMFILGIHLPLVLVVPALALFGTYLELWPANALGAVWGDPKRLHEDPARAAGASVPSPPPPAKRKRRRKRG
jgi:hypothetical protein